MSKDYIRGPWHVGPVDDTAITDANGEAVAYVEGDYEKEAYEMEARARLIAAAPDLLRILRVTSLCLQADGRFDTKAIDAAIAKAEPLTQPAEPHRPMVDHVSGHRIRERERYD